MRWSQVVRLERRYDAGWVIFALYIISWALSFAYMVIAVKWGQWLSTGYLSCDFNLWTDSSTCLIPSHRTLPDTRESVHHLQIPHRLPSATYLHTQSNNMTHSSNIRQAQECSDEWDLTKEIENDREEIAVRAEHMWMLSKRRVHVDKTVGGETYPNRPMNPIASNSIPVFVYLQNTRALQVDVDGE
jgi:hypothetical protein